MMPGSALDLASPRFAALAMPNHIISKVEPIDEYHLLDLGTGLSHAALRHLRRSASLHGSVHRGKFSAATSGLSITTRASKQTTAADVVAKAQAIVRIAAGDIRCRLFSAEYAAGQH